MPPKSFSKKKISIRLYDMVQAARFVTKAMDGIQYEQFVENGFLWRAVLRDMQVLGEAAYHMPVEVQKANPAIAWNKIIGLRHRLVHDYDGIDFKIIYETTLSSLPALAAELEAMLEKYKDQ